MNGFEAGAGLLADCCEDFRLGMKPFSEFVALCISPCLDGECPLRIAENCCLLHVALLFYHSRNCRASDTEKRLHIPLVKQQ